MLSFPRLSPDSGDQTVALLTQLVNASTGVHVEVQNIPFKAPASIVRVVAFAFIYLILTLLPILHPNCPYRTPLSGITYISFELSASSFFWVVKAIERIFHGLLMEIWRWSHLDVQGSRKDWPAKWRAMLKAKVDTHFDRFFYGLQCRVELGAMKATPGVGVNALRGTLTAFDEEKECEDFAACMPGSFDSQEPDATSTMLSLMSDQSTPKPILGTRLRGLLTTCLPGSSLLTEEQRTIRLRVPDGPVVLSQGAQSSSS
jgi:hypothetical protein